MSRDTERQRAKALKAADARDLINSSLPLVLPHMTPAQIDQVQRVLDSVVVNPAVQKDVGDLNRKSIRAESGPVVIKDPAVVARANKAADHSIRPGPADKRIRLNSPKPLDR